jgi:hypothetical protein
MLAIQPFELGLFCIRATVENHHALGLFIVMTLESTSYTLDTVSNNFRDESFIVAAHKMINPTCHTINQQILFTVQTFHTCEKRNLLKMGMGFYY